MTALTSLLVSILCAVVARVGADVVPFRNNEAYMQGAYGNYPRQHYLSDPHVTGPVANYLVSPQEGVSPSKYVMWAPGGPGLPRTHPMLLDANTLATVWHGPALDAETIGPTVQSCNGSDYITWWSGSFIDGYKQGRFYIYNDKYELAYNISGYGHLDTADAHDIFLTPACTAIYTAYKNREYDLTHYNITPGYIMDSYFQEIDLATGNLLFEWSASQHVEITDAIWQPPHLAQGHSIHNGYDFFHINSVEKDHKGNYLVSGRHTCTVYYISGVDGSVIWRVGGNSRDFVDVSGGKASNFLWQHHARWVDPETLTKVSLYDDRATAYHHDETDKLSRGMIIEFDFAASTVSLAGSYPATHNIESLREGSTQVLSDSPEPGNVINGYGQEPGWTEYAPNGTVLMDVMMGPIGLDRLSADNYRAIKVNWTGRPTWSPRIAPGPAPVYVFDPKTEIFAVNRPVDAVNDTVYLSWNGATDVVAWALLGTNDTEPMTVSANLFARANKTGFEDSVFVGATRHVVALAIGQDDLVLAVTSLLDMQAVYEAPSADSTNGLGEEHLATLTEEWRAYVDATRHGSWVGDRASLLMVLCAIALAAGLYCAVMRMRRGGGGGGRWVYSGLRELRTQAVSLSPRKSAIARRGGYEEVYDDCDEDSGREDFGYDEGGEKGEWKA